MTKILHSKYSYFILVMKGLMEEFFLPKIVYVHIASKGYQV